VVWGLLAAAHRRAGTADPALAGLLDRAGRDGYLQRISWEALELRRG